MYYRIYVKYNTTGLKGIYTMEAIGQQVMPVYNFATDQWGIDYRNSTFQDVVVYQNGTSTFTINTWYWYEVDAVSNNPNSAINFTVDGVQEVSLTNLTLSGIPWEVVSAGVYYDNIDWLLKSTWYFDDCEVSNTAYVGPDTPASVTISPTSVTLDAGQSQLFTSSVNDDSPYSYQWCLNGAPVSGATNPTWTFTPASAGSYTVYLNVTDPTGTQITSNTASVGVLCNLTVSVSGQGVTNATGTSGQEQFSNVSILATPDSGYVLSYWLLNGSDVGSANPFTVNMTDNWDLTAVFSSAVYLSLSVDPNQAAYAEGQSVCFDVTVINEAGQPLNSTLTLTITGPGGYGYFDFDRINVPVGYSDCSFSWTVPNVPGTYVVEVSLVPMLLTAYDAAWLEVA
jgi:hypothetical protein